MMHLDRDDYSLIFDALESKYGKASSPNPCHGNSRVFRLIVKLSVMSQMEREFGHLQAVVNEEELK